MNITFSLTVDDFLQYQLYVSSKSAQIKRHRRNARLAVPMLYLILSAYIIYNGSTQMGILFLLFGVAWYFLHPIYAKWRYNRYYRKYITQNYNNRIGCEAEITLDGDHIFSKDESGEGKISISAIESLIELPDHFFIQLNTGMSFIIPKKAIDKLDKFRDEFKNLDIPYVDETNWVMK